MTTATHTQLGYEATKAEGEFRVCNVPIFVECERDGTDYDAKWIKEAVAHAMQQQRDNYFPPLHIRHHGDGEVTHAGWFEIKRSGPITIKGKRLTAIFADLVMTNPEAEALVMSKRMPYRSIEVFDLEAPPSIDTLSLLDHEPPFHELPMLFVSTLDDKQDHQFSASRITTRPGVPMVAVASFRKGAKAQLLFREDPHMATKPKTSGHLTTASTFGAGVEDPKTPITFADDDKKDDGDGDGEEMAEDSGASVESICKMIESGDISVADMDKIITAIQAQGSEAEQEPEAEQPAPAPAPGDAMSKTNTAEFAAMQGKIDALEAKDHSRDASETRRSDVAQAFERLKDRPVGSDFEVKLVAFHKQHGSAAFTAYVDSMAETFGAVPQGDARGASFAAQASKVPAVAMKYQEGGVGAVDQAAQFAHEWEALQGRGLRVSQEAYVATNMTRLAGADRN